MATNEKELEDLKEIPLYLPKIKINSITPTLEKDGVIYANLLELEWHGNQVQQTIIARERKQLELNNLNDSNEEKEILLEVIKGDVVALINEEGKEIPLPKGYIKSVFLSVCDSYLFFPEIVDFMNSQTDDYDEDAYDWLSTKVFEDYGSSGFGLTPYDSSYMVQTDNGVFLLNEYLFEDIVEDILPGTYIGLKIEEVLLLSINKYAEKLEPIILTPEEKEKIKIKEERKAAYQALKERVRKRREAGEGPLLV